MTITAALPFPLNASVAPLSVARYNRMVEQGILTKDDRVELIENYLVLKMPTSPVHSGVLDLMEVAIPRVLPAGWLKRSQRGLVLSDGVPEPDLMVVRGTEWSLLRAHATAADAGLVVEIAASSLAFDQRNKKRCYARAGIPVYWIVNLEDWQIEAYTNPSGPTAVPDYADKAIYKPGDDVPLVLDGVEVARLPVNILMA